MSIQYTVNQLQRKFPGPPGTPGFARLADTMRAEGRWDEAIQLCQEGLRLRPFQLSGYLVLGKSLVETGRLDEAREQFEGALRLDPRCLSAMHALANIAAQLHWADAAAGYYRSILAVEPWDRQARESLGNAPSGRGPEGDATVFVPVSADATAYPGSANNSANETFEKPSGLDGDVMEVNLSEVADFLPADAIGAGADDLSLVDALSDLPDDSMKSRPTVSRFSEEVPEPTPKDILKPEELDETDSDPGTPAPISGQDVEDRLDSLFGEDDGGLPTSASATWTAAPAAAESRILPGDLDSATETNFIASGDLGDATTIQTEALSFAADPSATAFLAPGQDEIVGTEFASPGVNDRVEGRDIEDRLDALFHLTDGDASFPTTVDAPIDESGALTQAIDRADTGTGSLPVIEADAHVGMLETLTAHPDAALSETQIVEEKGLHDTDVVINLGNPANPGNEPVVTGADVADKLDDMFGVEKTMSTAAPVSPETADPVPEWSPTLSPTDTDEGMNPFLENDTTPKSHATDPVDIEPHLESAAPAMDGIAEPPPPIGDVMSTESMLPAGWLSDAGPQVTGADIEDQLDKIFQMETGKDPEAASQSSMNVTLPPEDGIHLDAAPGDEADKTMIMPAMRDPENSARATRTGPGLEATVSGMGVPRDAGVPQDAGLKESVTDWLSRQSDAADLDDNAIQFGEPNPIIVEEEIPSGFESPSEEVSPSNLAEESFGTLAPEDATALSETASIEMVDGADVAERLDELFASQESDATGSDTLGMEILPDAGLATEENLVSGAEVAARLDEMLGVDPSGSRSGTEERPLESGFPSPLGVESTPAELSPAGEPPILDAFTAGIIEPLRLDDEVLDPPLQLEPRPEFRPELRPEPSMGESPVKTPPVLPPMHDEEDVFPTDEEMPPQEGAGTNVATVTLAEIYFQQGLREQALQIYRQLLEREPGNDSVRKRIQEIEASKPDGENRGPDSDPRRPRPGLKVPKRKK